MYLISAMYFFTLGVVVTSYVGCTFMYVHTNFVHTYTYMPYINTYHVCMYVCMYSRSVDPLYLGCTPTIALVCLVVSISSVRLSIHLTTIILPFLYVSCSPFFCFPLFIAGGIYFLDDMTVVFIFRSSADNSGLE